MQLHSIPLFSHGIDLHRMAFYLSIVIGLVVFAVLIHILLKFRKSVSSNFHRRTSTEVIWTVIPFIFLMIMTIPATMILMKI